jgi:hypothetical protein
LDQDGASNPPGAGRSMRASMALLLLLLIPACSPARVFLHPTPSSLASPVELRLRAPLVTSFSSASPLPFRFTTPPDSVFRLDIVQRDMRLRVTVVRPDGATLLEQSTPVTGATSIVAAASLPGSYLQSPSHPSSPMAAPASSPSPLRTSVLPTRAAPSNSPPHPLSGPATIWPLSGPRRLWTKRLSSTARRRVRGGVPATPRSNPALCSARAICAPSAGRPGKRWPPIAKD